MEKSEKGVRWRKSVDGLAVSLLAKVKILDQSCLRCFEQLSTTGTVPNTYH